MNKRFALVVFKALISKTSFKQSVAHTKRTHGCIQTSALDMLCHPHWRPNVNLVTYYFTYTFPMSKRFRSSKSGKSGGGPKQKKAKVAKVMTEKEVRSLVSACSLEMTGFRPGEMALGIRCSAKTALLELASTSQSIGPRREYLQGLAAFPTLEAQFLDSLTQLPFFAPKDRAQRKAWLTEHARGGQGDLAALGASIKLLSLGSSALASLDEEEMEPFLQGTPQRADQILALFSTADAADGKEEKKEEKKKQKRPKLVFLCDAWRVLSQANFVPKPLHVGTSLPTMDLAAGGVIRRHGVEATDVDMSSSSARPHLYVIGGEMAIVPPSDAAESPVATYDLLVQRLLQTHADWFPADEKKRQHVLNEWQKCRRNLTCAFWKSLMQKTIRFAPLVVGLPDDTDVPVEQALAMTIVILAMSPGSFNPELRTHVSGRRAAPSRLATTWLEDSRVTTAELDTFVSLLGTALLAQTVATWRPSVDTVMQWIERGALPALNATGCFVYDTDKGNRQRPFVLFADATKTRWCTASALVDKLGGMVGDIGMFRYMAQFKVRGDPLRCCTD